MIQNITVRDTLARASDALFGDGVVVVGNELTGITMIDSVIAGSARLGLGSFGGQVSSNATCRPAYSWSCT